MVSRLSLIVVLLLAGCASAPATCQWVKPILISKDDRLTDGTADMILVHNRTWERNR